jgi:hypothetical protein
MSPADARTAERPDENMKIEIYDETYAGLKRIAIRTMSADKRVRYGGRTWVVVRRGGFWMLGYVCAN